MQTMDVSDIKKDAISLWFGDDNTNFYGIELTDKAYSKDGIVWHFAYVNRNNPEEYWSNQSKDCEYRVVSWRKEKSSNNDQKLLLDPSLAVPQTKYWKFHDNYFDNGASGFGVWTNTTSGVQTAERKVLLVSFRSGLSSIPSNIFMMLE